MAYTTMVCRLFYAYYGFMAFMFLGVVVMLNVLIAIVSDSYDNAQSRSRHLFLRSRLELAAELVLVMPPWLLRDAGYAPCRGDMLSLLLQKHESRATGTLRQIGGLRHFISKQDGYGGGGVLLLVGASTLFLPLAIVYAIVRLVAARLGKYFRHLQAQALAATGDERNTALEAEELRQWHGEVGCLAHCGLLSLSHQAEAGAGTSQRDASAQRPGVGSQHRELRRGDSRRAASKFGERVRG